ncbi:MAG: DinB family protein [Ardenticatenaceae bacterium]
MATGSQRRQKVLTRFENFHADLLSFVETCSDEDWQKITSAEQWSVGIVARHIGAAHYGVVGWVQLIMADQPLPPITMNMIHQMNAKQAEEHANCTQAEVLQLLQEEGEKVVSLISGLSDEELEHSTYFEVFNVHMTVEQVIKNVIIRVPQGHFESMKATVG